MWRMCIKKNPVIRIKVGRNSHETVCLGYKEKLTSGAASFRYLPGLLQAWPPVLQGPALGVMSWPHSSLLSALVLISKYLECQKTSWLPSSLFSADTQPKLTLYSLQWLRGVPVHCVPGFLFMKSYGILTSPWKQSTLKVYGAEWWCPTKYGFHNERALE